METSEFKVRTAKRQDIENFGINPYPVVTPAHVSLKDVLEVFSKESSLTYEDAEKEETARFAVCGRIVLFRPMGKNIFLQIQQGINRFQLMFSRGYTEWVGYQEKQEEGSLTAFKALEKKLDLGDFIHVEGYIFRTNKGEPTLRVKEATLLSKSLLPLPDKHAGLEDKHTRYRKRWLDLISNEDVYQTFLARSAVLKTVRSFLDKRGFLEVETPVLQTIYGGAEAKPFTTHLHALDQEMFLRISLEPPLKKLIVGGLERVFEIGKVFRNEGIDRSHNPEFTLLELYQSYADYNEMMDLVEALFLDVAKAVLGSSILTLPHPHKTEEEIEIDFSKPWARMTMEGSLSHYAGIDVRLLSEDEMREKLLKEGHMEAEEVKTLSRGLLVGALFEVFVEPFLIQPHHILDHPQETTPFAQPHRNVEEKKYGLVERFESFILCREMCNAYSELNDPELQRSLLERQAERRDSGDEEASPFDEDFVEAIEQGMPPTGGLGIGIDRLVMLFTKAASIRDVILFPMVRSHTEAKSTPKDE